MKYCLLIRFLIFLCFWSLLFLTRLKAKCWAASPTRLRIFFFFGATAPQWARASSFTRFLDHTQRRTAVGRTPLDEGSARRRDLYQTAHNTQNRQTSMPPVEFESTVSAGERPNTNALRSGHTERGLPQRTAVSVRWGMLHSKQTLLTIIF